MTSRTLQLEALESRTLLAADVVMFNDLVAGPGTANNVTTYAANGVAGGKMLDVESGADSDVTLRTFETGVTFDNNGANPASGTDAHDIFSGFVDFTTGDGSSLEIAGADRYTYEFSGLDEGKTYEFAGTSIRGNDNYTNRWTLVTIEGADSFTAAHSSGVNAVTVGLDANQVAILAGANHLGDQGVVAQWVEIEPGADGVFSVVSEQYTGATPGVGSGTADGSKSYGVAGIRLIERDLSLRVDTSAPADGAVVAAAPSVFVTDFNRPVDTSTLQTSDLSVNGQAALSVNVISDTRAEWTLPPLAAGLQTVTILGSAIDGAVGDDPIREFTSTFTIATAPDVHNVSASTVLATSATIGATVSNTGAIDPTLLLYWGTVDGGTNSAGWQNSINFDVVGAGSFTSVLQGLQQDTDYYFRGFAGNAAGERWAPATQRFTTTSLSPPQFTVDPVTDVGAYSASVSGRITDPGGEAPTVRVHYGETDGGTDPVNWDSQLLIGERVDAFADTIGGLQPKTGYFYRVSAGNGAGVTWAPATLSFSTTEAPFLLINEFMASNVSTLATRTRRSPTDSFDGPSQYPDWIEIQNQSAATVDLSGMHLTDDLGDPNKWQFPAGTTVAPNGYLVVYASARDIIDTSLDQTGRLHTNFSLSASGESIALTGVDGTVLDRVVDVPGQVQDVSFGFAGTERQYLATPTPNAANSDNVAEFVADTRFSVDRGFYEEPFQVEIASATPESTIRYTLDGTAPTATRGLIYSGPIDVAGTTTLRAMAFKPGLQPTNVDTQTYVFVEDVIRQTAATTRASGFPSTWGGQSPDYGMDPDVIGPNDDFGGQYAETIREDLKSLPTLSIVTDVDGIFGPGGIYSNPGSSSLEVPTSVEFFTEDGSEEFQINAGVKIQGGAFRSFGLTLKKSLRLKFKSEYGAAKLNYPVFGEDAAQEFDTLTLRMESNDGWQWGGANGQPQFARDEFGRRSHLSMGQPASHGRYTHVYINGVYWGMYNMVERPDQSFGESYLGSDKDDWDGLNSGTPINADDSARRDRATSAWNTLVSLSSSVNSAATEEARTAAFMRAQGLNSDGSNDPTRESYVDVENMIDYFLVNWYAGNSDWPHKNYYVGRENSPDSAGFQFFMWDSEWSLFLRSNLNSNRINNGDGVAGPIQNFRASEEFRLQFADRVQKHLLNPGGAFYVNPENPTYDPERPEDNVPAALYASITEEFFSGLVAESARWGDQHRSAPYTRDAEWQNEYDNIMSGWFPERTSVFLRQLEAADLYPSLGTPTFEVNGQAVLGGVISRGDTLNLISPLSEISKDTVLFTQGQAMQAFVPRDDSLETGPGPLWYEEGFTPSGWVSGTNGVGYADGSPGDSYDQFIGTDIRDEWNAEESSAYARVRFDLDADFRAEDFDRMKLRMKYDDGFIAYLNGQEIRRSQAPVNADWQSNATGSNSDSNAVTFEDFDVSSHKGLLKPGQNVLAFHVLNTSDSSSDMLGLAELVVSTVESVDSAPIYFTTDGTDPRAIGGEIRGTRLTDPMQLTGTTHVRARSFAGGEWSAMNEATFVVNPASTEDLIISEINYNPAAATTSELLSDGRLDNDDFEFVEILNRGTETVDLFGLEFNRGIDFEFPAFELSAGERVVLVQDAAAFRLRYGDTPTVIGTFTDGALSNSGERLTIVNIDGKEIADVRYEDGPLWPQAADGVGATLELIDPIGQSPDTINKYYAWRSSTDPLGSPGTAGAVGPGVVISEVLANSAPPSTPTDSIELMNTSNAAIDIGGWYLSDSASSLFKYQIAAGTTLAAGEYVVFNESDFNPTPLNPGPSDFALSSGNGDEVWLTQPTDGSFMFVDDVHFGATLTGQTIGLTENSNGRLVPLTRDGFGCGNGQALTGDAYIHTVNYLPASPTSAALAIDSTLDNNDLEYLVVRGPVTEGWRIRGGIDFDFPAGFSGNSNTWILSFDPNAPSNASKLAAFKSHYGIDGTPDLVGGYSGSLSNTGEQLRLQRPDVPVADEQTPYITVDEVVYDNLGTWPAAVSGDPIVRRASMFFGSDGTSWTHRSEASQNQAPAGDFDGDGHANAADLDLLIDAVSRGSQNPDYAIAGDGQPLSAADVEFLVQEILGTFLGDANLDKTVDAVDLNRLGLNWQARTCGGWQDGDFNGDQVVDAADLNKVGLNWQRTSPPAARPPRAALAHDATDVEIRGVAADRAEQDDVGAVRGTKAHADSAPTGRDFGSHPTRRRHDQRVRRSVSGAQRAAAMDYVDLVIADEFGSDSEVDFG